jgi:hypothetical protein
MIDTLTRYLSGVASERDRANLRAILAPLADRFSSQMLSNSTLVIKAASSALVKTGAAVSYGTVKGVGIDIPAGTDMAALSGTVTADMFNVYCFFVDSAETLTSAMGTEGATWATVKFPPFPENKTLVGFVRINPTGTGNFVGGTTALDDATVVPNAVYISPVGPFDPSVLL